MSGQNFTHIKDLTVALTVKELKSKYKSTTLGFLWILLNPLLQMLVLTIVFSFFLKIKVQNYPLFVFSGLLPWTFFSLSITSGTSSLINNRDLLKKVAFPREILPMASVLAHLFTFTLALMLLVVYYLIFFGLNIDLLFLLPIIFIETLLAISIALLLSSLDIYYRDVSFILQAILMIWIYITPILYPINLVPQKYLFFYNLNPMVGIITSFQGIFLGKTYFNLESSIISILETTILLGISIFVFRKRAKYFADWI